MWSLFLVNLSAVNDRKVSMTHSGNERFSVQGLGRGQAGKSFLLLEPGKTVPVPLPPENADAIVVRNFSWSGSIKSNRLCRW